MYFPKVLSEQPATKLGSDSGKRAESLRYSVDLANHISVCEVNYRKFMRLLPGLREGKTDWNFFAGSNNTDENGTPCLKVRVQVTDSAPYTTTLLIEQSHYVVTTPKITVRLYHDADLAEIISWDGHRNWRPQYEYPNIKMYHPDEKVTLNRFLSEWLSFCQENGFIPIEKCDQIRFSVK